jgi:hypothetical protein
MSTAAVVQVSTTPTREIEINLQGEHAVPPVPFPDMKVGETVRYVGNGGEVTVEFPGLSPFRTDEKTGTQVPGGVILTLVKSSEGLNLPNDTFHCGCSLTLPNGQTVGWKSGSQLSGGDPHVRKP